MPYYSRYNALYGALLRYGYEYTPLILCPLWGVLLRCIRYALQAVPMRGAFGSPSSRPALLSFGCSLLTGARARSIGLFFALLAVLSRARNAIDSGRGAA